MSALVYQDAARSSLLATDAVVFLAEETDGSLPPVYAKEYQQVQMEAYDSGLDDDTALQIALTESLTQGCAELMDCDEQVEEGHRASVQAMRASLPEFCHVQPIEPGGWCFYDSVLAHLQWPPHICISRYVLATAMLGADAHRLRSSCG